MYDLVCNLAGRGEAVTVLAINTPKHFQPPGVLPERVRLLTVAVNTNISLFKAFIHLFKTSPYNFARFRSQAYAQKLARLLQAETTRRRYRSGPNNSCQRNIRNMISGSVIRVCHWIK